MSGPVTAVRNDEFLAVVREAGVRLSPRRIAENAAAGTLVGRLRTSITEGDETFSYSIVDGAGAEDNAGFALVGDKLYSAAVFDHERQESYHVRIRATGDGGTVYEQSFTIEIIDVNETPTDIALAMEDLNRPRPAGTVAGTLSSDDPDEGDSFSYALVDGPGAEDNAKFVVVGNTLRAAADLDRVSGALSVRVRSTDSGGLWNEKVLAISMPALPPQASVVGTPQVTWQNTGQKCYDLTLRLTAFAAPLDLASIDGDELVVSGPAGMVAVSVESVTAAPDGYSAEVTYRLAAPGGRWDQADNGNYSLAVPAGSFADLAGHVNQAGDLGGMGATLRGSTDVQVRGTSTDDVLSVTLTNSEYVVQINGISFVYDASKVRSIVILGYGGNDRITINGESYICEVSAGAGNDTITGGSGDDLIRGDEDQDVIVGNGGEDTLYGNFGNDSITGGDGEDSLMGGLGADTLKGGLMGDSIYGGDQADSVYGDEGDDYIEGRGKADTIYGGAGNDTILGGAGSDAIWAEDGDDLIRVGLSILFADSVDGGAGNDASDGDANDELTNVESVLA